MTSFNAEQFMDEGRRLLDEQRYTQARAALEQARTLWYTAGRHDGALEALCLLALAARQEQLPLLAREYLDAALALSRELRDDAQETELLLEYGDLLSGMGETRLAAAALSQARTLAQQRHDPEREGLALYLSGKTLMYAGAMEDAQPLFDQAFPLLRGTSSWNDEIGQMVQLADATRVAHSVFGMLTQRKTPGLPDDLGGFLQEAAASGSAAAAQLSGMFANLQNGMAEFQASLAAARPATTRLIDQLADPDAKVRLQAARMLANDRGAAAVEPLFQAVLTDESPAVLAAALTTLAGYADPALTERIRAFQDHTDPHLRVAAALALAEQGETVADERLLEGVQAHDEGLRARAIRVIEQRKDPALGPAILPLLNDPSPKVRTKAAYTLGTLRVKEAIDGLIAATGDRYQQVRWAAVRVLGDLRDPRAVPALIDRLADANDDVRRSAATSLGKLKDARAVEALSAALADESDAVRASAQAALRKLKAKPSITVIREQLRHAKREVRAIAIDLVAAHDGSAGIPLLHEQLADPEPLVRLRAMTALANLNDRACIPAIMALLQQGDPLLQIEAMKLLGMLNASEAEPLIIELLKHENPYLRQAAIQALEQIGTRTCLPALATVQLRDEGIVQSMNSLNLIRLKVIAATAIKTIQARMRTTE